MTGNTPQLDFDTILLQTQAQIRAYVAGMGIARDDVDDLAQEVYLTLYRNMDKLPADVSPVRWLKGIAKNICLNHIRRSSRKNRLHREALAKILTRTRTKADRVAAYPTVADLLDGCVDKLPSDRRKIVDLRYGQELSSSSIAELLNSTAEAVRITLHRVRTALKDCITRSLPQEL